MFFLPERITNEWLSAATFTSYVKIFLRNLNTMKKYKIGRFEIKSHFGLFCLCLIVSILIFLSFAFIGLIMQAVLIVVKPSHESILYVVCMTYVNKCMLGGVCFSIINLAICLPFLTFDIIINPKRFKDSISHRENTRDFFRSNKKL